MTNEVFCMKNNVRKLPVGKVGVLKLSILLVLTIVLPLSAVMVGIINSKQEVPMSVVTVNQSTVVNLRNKLDGLHSKYVTSDRCLARSIGSTGTISGSTASDEDTSVVELLDLGYQVTDMLEAGVDLNEVFEYVMNNLPLDISQKLQNPNASDTNSQQSRGVYKTNVVFAIGVGYIVGMIASYYLPLYLESIFVGGFSAFVGPVL